MPSDPKLGPYREVPPVEVDATIRIQRSRLEELLEFAIAGWVFAAVFAGLALAFALRAC